jgi:hypothetical protein
MKLCDIEDESAVTPQRFDALLVTFFYLFNRFCKRRFSKIATDTIEIKFFKQFLFDNANQSYLSEKFATTLDEAWSKIWNICAAFSTECSNRINARNDLIAKREAKHAPDVVCLTTNDEKISIDKPEEEEVSALEEV